MDNDNSLPQYFRQAGKCPEWNVAIKKRKARILVKMIHWLIKTVHFGITDNITNAVDCPCQNRGIKTTMVSILVRMIHNNDSLLRNFKQHDEGRRVPLPKQQRWELLFFYVPTAWKVVSLKCRHFNDLKWIYFLIKCIILNEQIILIRNLITLVNSNSQTKQKCRKIKN